MYIKQFTFSFFGKFSSSIALMLILTSSSYSQSFIYDNLYLENKQSINPAFTGEQIFPKFLFSYKSNPYMATNNPTSLMFSASATVANKNGIGGRFYQNTFKTTNSTAAFLDYSYLLKLNNAGILQLGLSTGIIMQNQQTNTNETDVDNDAINGFEETRFDASLGFSYSYKNIEWGLALPNMLKLNDKAGFSVNSMLNYNLRLKEQNLEIKPGALAIYENGNFFYDLNLQVQWYNALWFGATYRNNKAVSASVGAKYHRLALSYAIEYQTSSNLTKPANVHQMAISYTFLKKRKKNHGSGFAPFANLLKKDQIEVDTINDASTSKVERRYRHVNTKKSSGRTNVPENSNAKKNYMVDEIGNGIYTVTPEEKNSLNNRGGANGKEIANEDSTVMSDLLDFIKGMKKKDHFELDEIDDGVYIVKSEINGNSIQGKDVDSLIVNSGLFNQLVKKENVENNKNASYTIELFIDNENFYLLTQKDISGNLLVQKTEDGKIHYYCGEFKSREAAIEYKQKLSINKNLELKIIELNKLE